MVLDRIVILQKNSSEILMFNSAKQKQDSTALRKVDEPFYFSNTINSRLTANPGRLRRYTQFLSLRLITC
jgi:hypothetical protein